MLNCILHLFWHICCIVELTGLPAVHTFHQFKNILWITKQKILEKARTVGQVESHIKKVQFQFTGNGNFIYMRCKLNVLNTENKNTKNWYCSNTYWHVLLQPSNSKWASFSYDPTFLQFKHWLCVLHYILHKIWVYMICKALHFVLFTFYISHFFYWRCTFSCLYQRVMTPKLYLHFDIVTTFITRM